MIAEFYSGVATGERGYTKGKIYTGYLNFGLVSGKYEIMFKDERGWNFVPADFKTIKPADEQLSLPLGQSA